MSKEIKAESEGQATGRDIINDDRNIIHVNFGANHGGQQFIANEPVHIHMAPAAPRPKVKVVIQPGPEHIDAEKKAALKSLVGEVVRIEGLVKKTPKGFGAVWNALCAKLKTTSYHLIPDKDYPRAEKYLREWIGRLSSMKSAPAKDANWRNRKYSFIFTNIRQLDADLQLRAYLRNKLGAESLKDLSDHDLQRVYLLVAGWKKAGHAPGQPEG